MWSTSRVLVACALWPVLGSVVVLAQKPVVRMPVFADYGPPPTTWSDLVANAKVVVHARVEESQNASRMDSGRAQGMTAYSIRVLDPIKGDIIPGQILTVLRYGGTTDRGDHVGLSFDPSFPAFQTGDNYVFFLTWNIVLSAFQVAHGPNGAFHVNGGAVEPIGSSPLSASARGRQLGEFLAATKRMSR